MGPPNPRCPVGDHERRRPVAACEHPDLEPSLLRDRVLECLLQDQPGAQLSGAQVPDRLDRIPAPRRRSGGYARPIKALANETRPVPLRLVHSRLRRYANRVTDDPAAFSLPLRVELREEGLTQR